jgi:uncharacterized membrane protein
MPLPAHADRQVAELDDESPEVRERRAPTALRRVAFACGVIGALGGTILITAMVMSWLTPIPDLKPALAPSCAPRCRSCWRCGRWSW